MDLLARQLEHDRWATDQLLERCRGLTDAQLDQAFDIGLQTLRTTFEDVIFNVEAWTAVMVGQPVDAPSGDRSLAALIDRHERSYPVFATFARRMLDKQRLEETFADYFADALRWRDRACRAA